MRLGYRVAPYQRAYPSYRLAIVSAAARAGTVTYPSRWRLGGREAVGNQLNCPALGAQAVSEESVYGHIAGAGVTTLIPDAAAVPDGSARLDYGNHQALPSGGWYPTMLGGPGLARVGVIHTAPGETLANPGALIGLTEDPLARWAGDYIEGFWYASLWHMDGSPPPTPAFVTDSVEFIYSVSNSGSASSAPGPFKDTIAVRVYAG